MTQAVSSSFTPSAVAEVAMQQCLRIALGQQSYAIRLDAVREILEVTQMTPLPLMPNFVRGVMNLRGAVVPVIDLRARLGLGETHLGRRTCVVIVDVTAPEDIGAATGTLGALVDAVYEVFDSHDGHGEPVPRLGMNIDPAYVRSILRVHGQATPELQLGTVLDQALLARLIAEHDPVRH